MGLMDSIRGLFSSRGKATAVYKRGMDKAKKRDFDGAIEDYSELLALANAPDDLKAAARFNRALAHSSAGDYDEAKSDLKIVISGTATPDSIRSAAEEKLKRYEQHRSGGDG